MSRSSISANDASTAPRLLRNLAVRAQRLLSEPAFNPPTEADPRELQSLLQQITHLERRFRSSRTTELQRWLAKVRQMVEERQEQVDPSTVSTSPVAR